MKLLRQDTGKGGKELSTDGLRCGHEVFVEAALERAPAQRNTIGPDRRGLTLARRGFRAGETMWL